MTVRLPAWLLAATLLLFVLVALVSFLIGRSIGRAEVIIVYQAEEMVRGQEAIAQADSAVLAMLELVTP